MVIEAADREIIRRSQSFGFAVDIGGLWSEAADDPPMILMNQSKLSTEVQSPARATEHDPQLASTPLGEALAPATIVCQFGHEQQGASVVVADIEKLFEKNSDGQSPHQLFSCVCRFHFISVCFRHPSSKMNSETASATDVPPG